jgi:hypothetical protein|tara:strand:+ start:146 stop:547 length:402 start_codon:yes stop_codon:yes gene_type:complete
METVMSLVDDIKEKISSDEYKKLVDQIMIANKEQIKIKEFGLEYNMVHTEFCGNCEEIVSRVIDFPRNNVKIRVCDEDCCGCCMGDFFTNLTMSSIRVKSIESEIERIGYCNYSYTSKCGENIVYNLIFSKLM